MSSWTFQPLVPASAQLQTAGGQIKVWTGSAWVPKPIKRWSGTEWVIVPLKFYNGSTFVLTGY
jgi:hypothetical protein